MISLTPPMQQFIHLPEEVKILPVRERQCILGFPIHVNSFTLTYTGRQSETSVLLPHIKIDTSKYNEGPLEAFSSLVKILFVQCIIIQFELSLKVQVHACACYIIRLVLLTLLPAGWPKYS